MVVFPFEFDEERFESIESLLGVDSVSFERRGRSAIEVSPQDIDQTGRRITIVTFDDPDFGSESLCFFHEFGGRPGVQPELI